MAAETEKELQQQKKRFLDLAERSYRQNLFAFTGFLSLAEQEMLWQAARESRIKVELSGGSEGNERQMARFGDSSELGYEEGFPITCILVQPLLEKFSDTFTHRDFLGAIMNLGIDRSTVGDIFIDGKKAYVYCTDTIAPYIQENLEQVRHTHVKCTIVEGAENLPVRKLAEKEVNVASLRADSIIAAVWNFSRSQSLELFRAKKVFINGRLTENNSCQLKINDIVSVRGYGKFIFTGEKYTTKKGKLVIGISLYI